MYVSRCILISNKYARKDALRCRINRLAWLEAERASVPAVDHDGVIPGPPLHLTDLLNHVSDGLDVGAVPIWCPVGDVELGHLVGLVALW